ncbi:hypothetical protein AM587_10001449 [Phytophthora nicotianae]|uniref:DDE Tnp4 domain-containing protein n=1 Tax=Phytophthora nicotianae TaxID=4792 RepID=A0A0W8DUV9_PHYNI|nr:hypothetical protein AM587_10001449 [Phytophthora nicotianae]
MVRSQDRQDRAAETLNEADFRASTAELFQREERRKAKVAQIVVPSRRDDNDEGDNSGVGTLPSVFDFCLQAEGPDGVLKLTNFAPEEFDHVWAAVYPHLQGKWNVGRGKKCRYAARDVFFMTLSSLKHLGKWDTVARVFRIPPSTFQKMIRKFMDILSPILYEMYVEKANDQWTLGKIVRSGHAFKYFPYARYATDVTFQHANKPSGNMSEILRCYSGKHHLYGYKVEVSVLPNGVAINCTEHTGGSTHDAEIFRRNAAFHSRALHKHSSDANVRDEGKLQDKYPKEWAVLVDKGYQGMAREYRAIHPIKSGRLQPLSLEDASFNDELAHDRVIVENFFGRLKSLWGICSEAPVGFHE